MSTTLQVNNMINFWQQQIGIYAPSIKLVWIQAEAPHLSAIMLNLEQLERVFNLLQIENYSTGARFNEFFNKEFIKPSEFR